MGATVTPVTAGMSRCEHARWKVFPADDRMVVTQEGDLDFASAGGFVAALAALGASGAHTVVDMDGVEFIDAPALGVVARAQGRFHSLGLRLTAPAPARPVDRTVRRCPPEDVIGTISDTQASTPPPNPRAGASSRGSVANSQVSPYTARLSAT